MQGTIGVLHHTADGSGAGFDWVDVVIGIAVLAVLGAVAFGISKLVQRRRGED